MSKDNLEQNKAAKAKKAPPRKTAAQKKEEAREAQAKEAEGQGDLFSSGSRLETKVENTATLEADIADLGI